MLSVRGGSTSEDRDDPTPTPRPLVAGAAALLRRQLAKILGIAVVVFLAVMVGWFLWPVKYTAVALVALDPQTPRLTADRDSPNFTGDASAVVSLAEVATSDGFLVSLAQRQKLADDPEFADGTNGVINVAAELRRNLKVTRRGLTYLIDISFTSKDPEKAARIANAVASEIVQRQQSLRKDASGGISEALRSRLADLRAAVLTSEKAVADYRQANGLLDSGADGSLGLKRLNSLTEQLGPLRARLEDARARFDKLRRAKTDEEADPSIFKSDRLAELLTRLGDEKRSLASAERTFGPRHPSVEAAQARIASVQEAVRAERGRIVEQAKAEVDVLTEQNAAYETEIAKRTREQLATEQKQVVLQDLMRQAQADRQIYEQFLARQKATQEQSDLIQPEAVIVSAAEPPTKSNRPGMKLAGLAGLLGGLGAGVLWAMFGPRRSVPITAPEFPLAREPVVAASPEPVPVTPAPIVAPPAPEPSPVAVPLVAEPVVPAEVAPEPVAVADPAPAAPVTTARVTTAPAAEESALVKPTEATPTRVEPPVAPTEGVVETVVPPIATAVAAVAAVVPEEPDVPAPMSEAMPASEPIAAPDPTPEVSTPDVSAPSEAAAPAVAPSTVVEPIAPASGEPVAAASVEDPALVTAEAPTEAAGAVRVSARRHDPAQRLRRMLRRLTDHDVPLVADLTPTETSAEEALAPFAATLVAHLAANPGLAVSVVGVDGAAPPADLADRLAEVVADHGYVVALKDVGEPTPAGSVDLVVDVLPADTPAPIDGEHPFVLIVAEATREAEERLDAALDVWERDPERVVVAAFAPAPAVADEG